MAKSWDGLKLQHDKIRSTYEKISPPVPSDEFEAMRQATLAHMGRMDAFLVGQVSGEGFMTEPAAEPEG
jgi:hypothetical protein